MHRVEQSERMMMMMMMMKAYPLRRPPPLSLLLRFQSKKFSRLFAPSHIFRKDF